MKKWKLAAISTGVILLMVGSVLGTSCQTSELNSTKAMLATTQDRVSSLEVSLTSTKSELETTLSDLTHTKDELIVSQNELTTTEANLTQTQTQLKSTQLSLEQTQASLISGQTELSKVKEQLAGITNGYGFVLNDPTYASMKSFLASDSTNTHSYNNITYNCFNYTADVIANAAIQHIRCAYVRIAFPTAAHAVVAFNTIDKGLIYIEPQNDAEVNLAISQHYSPVVAGNYVYAPYDDTVQSFTIIW